MSNAELLVRYFREWLEAIPETTEPVDSALFWLCTGIRFCRADPQLADRIVNTVQLLTVHPEADTAAQAMMDRFAARLRDPGL